MPGTSATLSWAKGANAHEPAVSPVVRVWTIRFTGDDRSGARYGHHAGCAATIADTELQAVSEQWNAAVDACLKLLCQP